jgi:molybdate/tungstate transport system ATP-binding protein
MLELRHVTRRWDGFALRDVCLTVGAGEYFVLMGPSGAGKSLLLELTAGFHAPDSGRVLLGGRDVTALPPERRDLGFVYQDSMLFPHLTAAENVAYGLRVRGRPPGEVEQTVGRLARMLHIGHVLGSPPDRLSGGERQRVAIARALAVEPRVLLLDEPLGSLDPVTARGLRAELKALHRATGVTALHVTHDQAEAREMGVRFGVIQAGRLVQTGEAAQVFERPANGFIAEFTGWRNIYEGHAEPSGDVTAFRSGEMVLFTTCRARGPVRAAVHPDSVIVSNEPVKTSARNRLAGVVVSVAREGNVYAVTAQVHGVEMISLVTAGSLQELDIRPGRHVYLSFKAHSLHLMAAKGAEGD